MEHRLIIRVRSGFCTDEDLKQYFRKENVSLTGISRVQSVFLISFHTEEDRHKLLEKKVIKITSDTGESELFIESEDSGGQLSIYSESESEGYDLRSVDSFVVVNRNSDEDADLQNNEIAHECPPLSFKVEGSHEIQELMKKTVKVQNVWSDYNVLRNFVAMEKKGGGDLEHEFHSEKEGIAYFVFENPEVASNLLKKGQCKIMNHNFKFELPEVAEYISINYLSSDDAKQSGTRNVNSKLDSAEDLKLVSMLRDDNCEACGGKSQDETDKVFSKENVNQDVEDEIVIKMKNISFADVSKPIQEDFVDLLDVTTGKTDNASSSKQDLGNQEKLMPPSTFRSPKKDQNILLGESVFASTLEDLSISKEPVMTTCSIAIYGIPSENFIEDALLCFLEHKRKGGGEILNHEFDQSLRKLIATFQDERVAENISRQKVLKVRGHELFVLSSEGESELRRTVFVPDVQSEENAKMLACYMESGRKGGGPVEFEKYNNDRNEFSVRFVDQRVAERFKKRKIIKVMGVPFSMLEAPIFILVDVEFGPRTIFVGQIQEDIHEDVLIFLTDEMFGGPVLFHKFNQDFQNMEVVFYSESVATKLLDSKFLRMLEFTFPIARSLEELSLINNQEAITEIQKSDKESRRSCTTSDDAKEPIDESSIIDIGFFSNDGNQFDILESFRRNEMILTENMKNVFLTNIWKDVSEMLLRMFIENKIVHGRFLILDFYKEKREALIEFEDPQDALRLFESNILMERMTPHLLESNPDDFQSHAIIINNAKGIDKEMLGLYFENKKSDGGLLKEWDFLNENTFYAVFENLKDAKSVLARNHNLGERKLKVQELKPQRAPQYIKPELIDSKKLFVKNLRSKINKKYFIELMEKVGRTKVEELIQGKKLAMLVFQSEPDYFSLRKYTSCYPINGYMVMFMRVAQSNHIQISFHLDTNIDSIKKHLQEFDERVQIKVNEEIGLMKATFETREGVQLFLTSEMMVSGKIIDAKPYYEELQIDNVVPKWVKIFHDDEVLKFVQSQSDVKVEIENSLKSSISVEIIWPTSGSEIILNITSEDAATDWWINAKTKLKELLEPFHQREKTCLQDNWREVIGEVKEKFVIYKQSMKFMDIKYDKENYAIRFIGRSRDCKIFGQLVDDIINKILSRKQKVCEQKEFSPKQILLVKKMLKSLTKPNGLCASITNNNLKLEGPSECVNNFKIEILKQVSQFFTEEFHFQQNIDKFLRRKNILNYFNNAIEKKNIHASVLVESNDNIAAIADCEQSLSEIRELIKSNVKEGFIPLLSGAQIIMTLKIWTNYRIDLLKKLEYFEVELAKENDILSYVCLACIEKELIESIKVFLIENMLGEVFLEMHPYILKTILRFYNDDFKLLEEILKEQGGRIIETRNRQPNKSGLLITGNKSGLDSVVHKFGELKNKIKVEKITLKKPGIVEFTKMMDFTASLNHLETNRRVLINLSNKELCAEYNDDKVFEISFSEKLSIVVTTEDVLASKVDVIVHISHTALEPNSQNIFKLGGDEMITKTREEMQKKSSDDIDYIFTTNHVGNLPCNSICHVVIQDPDNDQRKLSLKKYIHEALKYANDTKYSSLLVMCPYKKEDKDDGLYLKSLVHNLVSYDGQSTGTMLSITILCMDSKSLNFCKSVLLESKEIERKIVEKDDEEIEFMECDERHSKQFEFLDIENIHQGANMPLIVANHIEVVIDSIVNVKADVIVNSTNQELDLKKGQASICLLAAAGYEIQKECLQNKPNNFSVGDVVSTYGYRLKCDRVYHVICPMWKSGQNRKLIREIVRNVLTKASTNSFKSVAFPALGTGNLNAPPNEIAFLMMQEAASFLEKNKYSSIKKIYFVVYEKDVKTVKAFNDCWINFTCVTSGVTGEASGGASEASGDASGYNIPITIDASDPYKLNLNGLEVEVVEGNITSINADAIVNSTSEKMDLSGAVAQAIMRKGGIGLTEEMKRAKMKPNGVCVTKAGNLPSNFIVHLVAKRKMEGWSSVINQALVEADSYGCNTIAFPVLGTGNFKFSPEDIAPVMIQAFQMFAGSEGHKNLKKIFVCIFLKDIMKGFISGVKKMNPSKSGGMISRAFYGIKDTLADSYNSLKNKVFSKVPHHAMLPIHASNVDHSHITLEVYGPPNSDVSSVLKIIVSDLEASFGEKTLDSDNDKEIILKLKKSQISRINGLQGVHKVDIVVNMTKGNEKIVVSGFIENCTEALKSITDIFTEVRREEELKKEADDLKELILWEYKDKDNNFKPYTPKLNLLLEKACSSGKMQCQWFDQSNIFSVNFKDMTEISNNNNETEIRRVKAGNILPKLWSMVPESEKFRNIVLDPNDVEYKTVEQNARATSNATLITIHMIERIQNPTLYTLYQTKKAAMEDSMQGKQVEMTLWHGTSANVITYINNGGFNRSYCGKNATVYGCGTYFARNFWYSAHQTYSPPDATGIKTVYQCKVLVGEYTTGSKNFIAPPIKPNSQDSYDSVVNNVNSPEIFVVFYDNQAYPEYLIHFS